MPKNDKDFIVTTRETVEGTYRVRARNEEHAKDRINDIIGMNGRNWNGIEQVEYMAYDVEAIEAYRA